MRPVQNRRWRRHASATFQHQIAHRCQTPELVSGGGLCAFLNLPEDAKGTAMIESKTNLFGAVREGHITATSRPLHKGTTTIVVETDVHDAQGRYVARVTQTQAVLR